ncbi:MAG: PQQ-binding-like beta-propeller repeat protein [Planctomycetota bacterium]
MFKLTTPTKTALTCIATLLFVAPSSVANDSWPRFRGAAGNGISSGKPPVEFGANEMVKWRQSIEGVGWSSPVYSDGVIWLTSAIAVPASPEEVARKKAEGMASFKTAFASVEFKAMCIDYATGKLLHNLSLAQTDSPDTINPMNSFASPTPTISDGLVYCDFGNYGTWCLDLKTGKEVWRRTIEVDYSVGPGSSPMIYDDKLILVCDGIDAQFVLALNKKTGETIWKTARPTKKASNVEFQKAYCSPIVAEVAGKEQIVIPTAQWICGYNPEDGKEIWRLDHGRGFSLSPSPIQTESGSIIFSTGYMRPELVAVDPSGSGDVSATHQKWRVSRSVPAMPSPIASAGKVFMLSDAGVLTCIQDADGSIAWQERIPGNYSASPILVDGKLYLCSREGVVTVVDISGEFKVLASNEFGQQLMASPAVIGNDLLIRSDEALYRIGN